MKVRSTRAVVCLALLALLAPASFGKKPERKSAEAKILDQNSYLCSGCFFGVSDYYYCFDTGDKILIAYQKVPQMNWKEHETNLLTRAHKAWATWVPGGNDKLSLTYDEKMVYVKGGDGKEVKLHQNYGTDIFLHSSACRAAVHKAE